MAGAVIPVKRLEEAKLRLAGQLDASERRALVLDLLDHILATLAESQLITESIVVTPDPEVARRVRQRGGQVVHQEGSGLNEAILLGRREAGHRGADTMLILLADLPFLRSEDVDGLVRLAGETGVAIAPDRHERGTNALALQPIDRIEPRFGIGSLEAHREEVRARGLIAEEYRAPGTRFDVDTPADLEEYRQAVCDTGRLPPRG